MDHYRNNDNLDDNLDDNFCQSSFHEAQKVCCI